MTDATEAEAGPSDDALIARWRGGDERAATLLVERHAPPLVRFLASLGAEEAAEELVQDTFVRAFGSLDSFRGESSLRTWLFTIARNLMRDRVRAAKIRKPAVPLLEDHAATEHTALDQTVADETEGRLREAVRRLTPLQRDVFTLRVTEGLSYKEIADLVGSTEGSARVHYFNAVRSLKEWLSNAH